MSWLSSGRRHWRPSAWASRGVVDAQGVRGPPGCPLSPRGEHLPAHRAALPRKESTQSQPESQERHSSPCGLVSAHTPKTHFNSLNLTSAALGRYCNRWVNKTHLCGLWTCVLKYQQQRKSPIQETERWSYDLCRPDTDVECHTALSDWLLHYGEQIYYDRLSRALQHIGRIDIALGENLRNLLSGWGFNWIEPEG